MYSIYGRGFPGFIQWGKGTLKEFNSSSTMEFDSSFFSKIKAYCIPFGFLYVINISPVFKMLIFESVRSAKMCGLPDLAAELRA